MIERCEAQYESANHKNLEKLPERKNPDISDLESENPVAKIELTDTGGKPIRHPSPKAILAVLDAGSGDVSVERPGKSTYALVSCPDLGIFLLQDDDETILSTYYGAELVATKELREGLVEMFWTLYRHGEIPENPDDFSK